MALTSFFTALTGLNSSSHSINVIGDNLANLNTIGFKAGKATFAELIGSMSGFSSTGNPIVFGQGSALNGVVNKQTEGSPEYTGNSTDAMISGNGFFIVDTGEGNMGYTRAGRFQFDRTGNLLSSDGYQLMGYMARNGEVDTATSVGPIDIRLGQFMPAVVTSEISAAVNLDSRADNDAGGAPPVPDTFATAVDIYDSLGNVHTIRLQFTKTNPANDLPTWSLSAQLQGNPPVPINIGGAATVPLTFTPDGMLATPTGNLVLNMPALGTGLTAQPITLRLSDDQGRALFTSAAAESGTSFTSKNGSPPSTLANVSFSPEGFVIGQTANGQNIILAQLAVATFPNIQGLQKFNGSTFTASLNAGEPSIGVAGSGGRGTVMGGRLEMSNVDMAEEFINLIIAQRSYQANTRMISTSDELYMEAINLKR